MAQRSVTRISSDQWAKAAQHAERQARTITEQGRGIVALQRHVLRLYILLGVETAALIAHVVFS